MGSWNGTCGVSQLPIRNRERILLFPVMKNKHAKNGSGGYSYSHNQYSVISIPLHGKFDDHGGIKEITRNEAFVLHHFQSLAKRGTHFQIDQRRYDRAKSICSDFTGEITDTEMLVDWFMRDPIYKGLGYMLVHEDMYLEIINDVSTRKSFNSRKTKKETLIEQGEEFLKEIDILLSQENEINEKIEFLSYQYKKKQIEEEAFYKEYFPLAEKVSVLKGHFRDYFPYQNEFVSYFTEHKPNSFTIQYLLFTLMKTTNKNEQKEVLLEMVDLILFDIGMSLMRKTWMPQSGAGNQGNEHHLHKLISTKVLEKERSLISEYLEDNIVEVHELEEVKSNLSKENL